MNLRQSEMEIMEALWGSQGPMSSAALIDAIPQRKWKERSIFAILDGLLKKELIYEAGFVRRGKTIARTFAPTMTYSDFVARQTAQSPNRPALPALMSAFLDTQDVTQETLDELEALIAKRKAELQDDQDD